MYNWPQTRRSEAINRIETRRVVKRMLNKFGDFLGLALARNLDWMFLELVYIVSV